MRIKALVDRIVADGRITREEREELHRAVCEDPELSAEEREQIGRIVRLIESGLVRLDDADAESAS